MDSQSDRVAAQGLWEKLGHTGYQERTSVGERRSTQTSTKQGKVENAGKVSCIAVDDDYCSDA